jgi:hypothetical protein
MEAMPEFSAAFSDFLEWVGCGRARRAERLAEFVENVDPGIALPALREAMKAGNDFPPQQHQVQKQEVVYCISFQPRPEGMEEEDEGPVRLPLPEDEERLKELTDKLPLDEEEEE